MVKVLFWGIVLGVVGWWTAGRYFQLPPSQTPEASASPTLPRYQTIEVDGVSYAYGLLPVAEPTRLELIPNYENRAEAAQLMSQNGCQSAVNAGFYAQDFRPLGLVVVSGKQVSPERSSQLFNGYLVIAESGKVTVGRQVSKRPVTAVQSGPLLLEGGRALALNLSSDKQSRRIVGTVTYSGDLIFMAVFDPVAETMGPHLSDLPQIVEQISGRENLRLNNAINLDGGRASVFYSPLLRLKETDPVGAIFCLK